MREKRSSDQLRTPRDRSVVSLNKTRARAMRLSPTEAERKLWWHLRHRLPLAGTHFRRQVRLGNYIVDFASHGLKIVIELDGGQHATQVERDEMRSIFLRSEGYRVLRFWNNEVMANIDGVLELVHNAVLATPTPTPPHKGEGKEFVPSHETQKNA
jgi:very-short-patch-repair endonuclease